MIAVRYNYYTVQLLLLTDQHNQNKSPEQPPSSGRGGKDWFNKNWFEEIFQPQNRGTLVGVALATATGYVLMQSSTTSHQISWQEFRISYLDKGEVTRMIGFDVFCQSMCSNCNELHHLVFVSPGLFLI